MSDPRFTYRALRMRTVAAYLTGVEWACALGLGAVGLLASGSVVSALVLAACVAVVLRVQRRLARERLDHLVAGFHVARRYSRRRFS